jgi:hypothetical protein
MWQAKAGKKRGSLALEEIETVEPGGADFDHHLVVGGLRIRKLDHLEHLGTTVDRVPDRLHGAPASCSARDTGMPQTMGSLPYPKC